VAVEQEGLHVGGGEVWDEVAGGDDGAVGELAQLGEPVVAEDDAEQRTRPPAWWCAGGALGHLDQRGRAAHRDRACDPGGLVGEVELAFDAVQDGGDGGAGDGVELGVEADHAVQHR